MPNILLVRKYEMNCVCGTHGGELLVGLLVRKPEGKMRVGIFFLGGHEWKGDVK